MTIRDRVAIAGVGRTELSKNSGVSTLTLALRAVRAALDDAGLHVRDVDGVATHGVGDSAPAPVVAAALGIRDVAFLLNQSGGGGLSATVVGYAAAAIATGQASVVVCWRAINARSEFRMGGTGRDAPPLAEFQYQVPYGYLAPPQQFAMLARELLDGGALDERVLGTVSVTQRSHAARNPRAMLRTPLSLDDYLASPWVVEPLRLLDCCLETDAAVAVVLTSASRARDLARPPVHLRAFATGGGDTLYSTGRSTLAPSAAALMAPRLFRAAGLAPSDIDVAELYDAFTPLVPLQLEDYGFCPPGGAAEFILAGETAIGGTLPVNTHGGHLSEGYVHGLNHVAEAVDQLRGDAGDRQVAGARTALVSAQPGYVGGVTSALILGGPQ
ncbi:lipid-transfer protein [Dactylosporangium sp. NBC_01737]|uniref:thiolase C-terminal domain-containing protein n=1 Tax=Dactylosporangium sp. NBC_01737 TaxID=2975959 RepID=UPI002E0EFC81|nr:lipid-transfer protein [Dactylosporangium sp. NBC_01737]